MKPPSEQERLEQRFITRTQALSLLRISLALVAQVFFLNLIWAIMVTAGIFISYRLASEPKWGRLIVFLTLNLDLAWLTIAIAHTGFFQSPLIATLPAMTLLFTTLFHQPIVLLPPLLVLPILTSLSHEVSIETLALFTLLNACTIYLTNKILGEEEATSCHIIKLELIEERQRLSREIHDGVGSVLSALILQAEQEKYFEIRDLAREALQETRYAISIMRDDLDLNLQIKNYLELFSKRHQIKINWKLSDNLSTLSNTRALSILRILQESLTNIAKHAQASTVEVQASLEQNQLLLNITDNGIGFDLKQIPKNHYGIRNIQERVQQMGGSIHIQSQPNSGTQIQIGASL